MMNRKTPRDYTDFIGIVSISLLIAFAYGWIANIITIFGMEDITSGEGIIRIIGIFMAPLGAIMGYL